MAKKIPKLKPKYSGTASVPFWTAINSLRDPGMKLYGLGCKLQNDEQRLLDAINEAASDPKNLKTK